MQCEISDHKIVVRMLETFIIIVSKEERDLGLSKKSEERLVWLRKSTRCLPIYSVITGAYLLSK